MSRGKILVLGGAHIDRRGRIFGETAPGASNPGDLGPLRREGADESENDGEDGGASGAG